jgi:hypothetical protein
MYTCMQVQYVLVSGPFPSLQQRPISWNPNRWINRMSLPIYIRLPLSLVVFFTTNQDIPCPSSRQCAAARFTQPGRFAAPWCCRWKPAPLGVSLWHGEHGPGEIASAIARERHRTWRPNRPQCPSAAPAVVRPSTSMPSACTALWEVRSCFACACRALCRRRKSSLLLPIVHLSITPSLCRRNRLAARSAVSATPCLCVAPILPSRSRRADFRHCCLSQFHRSSRRLHLLAAKSCEARLPLILYQSSITTAG